MAQPVPPNSAVRTDAGAAAAAASGPATVQEEVVFPPERQGAVSDKMTIDQIVEVSKTNPGLAAAMMKALERNISSGEYTLAEAQALGVADHAKFKVKTQTDYIRTKHELEVIRGWTKEQPSVKYGKCIYCRRDWESEILKRPWDDPECGPQFCASAQMAKKDDWKTKYSGRRDRK